MDFPSVEANFWPSLRFFVSKKEAIWIELGDAEDETVRTGDRLILFTSVALY
jgi:hypothetical protein